MGCQRKRCEPRRDGAGFLAAVAVLGLIATPLLHAEEHCNEAHEAGGAALARQWESESKDPSDSALARQWESESKDPSDALASALEHVHSAPRQALDQRHQGHSHGPAGTPHGSGSLEHFALALHAAPRLPQLTPPTVAHAPPLPFSPQLRGTLAYLIPEGSRGPPPRC